MSGGRIMASASMAARFGLFAVLVYAGMLKLHDPRPASEFLHSLLGAASSELPTRSIARGAGMGEIAVALALVIVPGWRAGAVAGGAIFTAFAVLHGMAMAGGVSKACGCLGKGAFADVPPAGRIAINTACAALCAWLAVRRDAAAWTIAGTSEGDAAEASS